MILFGLKYSEWNYRLKLSDFTLLIIVVYLPVHVILMTDDLVEMYEIHYEDILAMEINNKALCDVEDRV